MTKWGLFFKIICILYTDLAVHTLFSVCSVWIPLIRNVPNSKYDIIIWAFSVYISLKIIESLFIMMIIKKFFFFLKSTTKWMDSSLWKHPFQTSLFCRYTVFIYLFIYLFLISTFLLGFIYDIMILLHLFTIPVSTLESSPNDLCNISSVFLINVLLREMSFISCERSQGRRT